MGSFLPRFPVIWWFLGILCTLQKRGSLVAVDCFLSTSGSFFTPTFTLANFSVTTWHPWLYITLCIFPIQFPYWFPLLGGHLCHMAVGSSCAEYMLAHNVCLSIILRDWWKPVCTGCISCLNAYIHYTCQSGCTSGLYSGVCTHLPFSFLSALVSIPAICVGNWTISVQCISLSPLQPFCLHLLQGTTIRLVCFAYLLRCKAQYRKCMIFDSVSWECMQIHCGVGYS